MEELFEKMAEVLIAGKQEEVKSLTQEALDNGAAARDILDKGLLAGMDVVGQRFKAGDMFIPKCFYAPAVCMGPWIFSGPCCQKPMRPVWAPV